MKVFSYINSKKKDKNDLRKYYYDLNSHYMNK